jgi:hypothetical protein
MGRSGVLDITTFEALDASCKEEVMGRRKGKERGERSVSSRAQRGKNNKTNITRDVGAER